MSKSEITLKDLLDFLEELDKEVENKLKANRPTKQKCKCKCKCKNIGFKEVYNGSGILFVLTYDKETGKILDSIQIDDTDIPFRSVPCDNPYPLTPGTYPYPHEFPYYNTTGNPPINMPGTDSTSVDCTSEDCKNNFTTNDVAVTKTDGNIEGVQVALDLGIPKIINLYMKEVE